jgi:hypothetical protein
MQIRYKLEIEQQTNILVFFIKADVYCFLIKHSSLTTEKNIVSKTYFKKLS